MDNTGDILSSTSGDGRFYDLLFELAEMHAKKSHDYGLAVGEDSESVEVEDFLQSDPLFNFRGSILWNVDPWVGALIRAADKTCRLQTHSVGHQLSNESVRDTLLDAASYHLIALILYEEQEAMVGENDENSEEEDF